MASNYAMAASITAAAAALSDWTANMAEDPQLEECGRHRFLIAGSFESPFGFWQWLAPTSRSRTSRTASSLRGRPVPRRSWAWRTPLQPTS